RTPYTGSSPADVMKKHVSKKVQLVPPDHVNTTLSSGFGEVVETMMSKDREGRYRNPSDLIIDLECLTKGQPPKIATHRVDALSALAEGSTAGEDDLYESPAGGTRVVTRSGGPGTAVVVLSVLLAISVLLNLVQLLSR